MGVQIVGGSTAVDISGKMDKIGTPVLDDFVSQDASGNAKASGYGASSFEVAGAAAAAQAYAIQRGNHTGTQALSTLSDIGATGTSLAQSATQDAARAVLNFAAVTTPARELDHAQLTFTATDVVGTGAAQTVVGCYFNLTTGATANSTVRHRINDNGIGLNRHAGVFADWSRRLEISTQIRLVNENAEGVLRLIYGKTTTQAFGLAANGNYIGVQIENASVVSGFVCKAGTVTTVPFTPVSISGVAGGLVFMTSLNGTVTWYINGTVAGTTALGPVTNDAGSINFELLNGATAAVYRATIVSGSKGYY